MSKSIITKLLSGIPVPEIARGEDQDPAVIYRLRNKVQAAQAIQTILGMFVREATNLTQITDDERHAIGFLDQFARKILGEPTNG